MVPEKQILTYGTLHMGIGGQKEHVIRVIWWVTEQCQARNKCDLLKLSHFTTARSVHANLLNA